jgi:hypothetical protein
MVPGGGLFGISGVESGKAAPLVGGPPGVELHTVVDALPSGDTGDMVPIVLTRIGEGMVPSGVAGIIASDDFVVVDDIVAVVPGTGVETVLIALDGAGTGIGEMEGCGRAGTAGGCGAGMVEPKISVVNDVAGCADSPRYCLVPLSGVDAEEFAVAAGIVGAVAADGIVPKVPPIADMDVTGTAGVPGTICPVGVEQVTTVPGVAGSEASGTGASVVSGLPGWGVAENGLGPLSGDVTIVPGVDGRPMAVLPMVETCARQALPPASKMAVMNSRCRIATPSSAPISSLSAVCEPRPCCLPPGSPSD